MEVLELGKPPKINERGSERLRGIKNDAKRRPGRLRERKMSQHEAPRRAKRGTIVIEDRTNLVIPCAAHRPPHQREELKAQVNEKAWLLH